MTEDERKRLNAERLKLIDTSIRSRVAHVITDMEAAGHKPFIHGDVWRSPQKQIELFKRGVTKVRWGFHCATTPQGKPGALAADVIDASKGWNAPATFWLALGAAAKKHGLHWGGYFGLTSTLKKALHDALGTSAATSRMKLGWDVAHVEIAGVTVAQAKAGKR